MATLANVAAHLSEAPRGRAGVVSTNADELVLALALESRVLDALTLEPDTLAALTLEALTLEPRVVAITLLRNAHVGPTHDDGVRASH